MRLERDVFLVSRRLYVALAEIGPGAEDDPSRPLFPYYHCFCDIGEVIRTSASPLGDLARGARAWGRIAAGKHLW